MRPSETGSMTNWPKEPTAMVIPIARERFSGATSRESAPKMTGKVVPERPRPMRTPAPSVKAASPPAVAMSQRPAA